MDKMCFIFWKHDKRLPSYFLLANLNKHFLVVPAASYLSGSPSNECVWSSLSWVSVKTSQSHYYWLWSDRKITGPFKEPHLFNSTSLSLFTQRGNDLSIKLGGVSNRNMVSTLACLFLREVPLTICTTFASKTSLALMPGSCGSYVWPLCFVEPTEDRTSESQCIGMSK